MDILSLLFNRTKYTLSLSFNINQGFTFSASTKSKPVSISQALSKLSPNCLPLHYFNLNQTEALIDLSELLPLRNALSELSKDRNLKSHLIEIDPKIFDLHQISCPTNFEIRCTWNHHHKLLVQFPSGIEPYIDGWFKKGNEIWSIPAWTNEDNRWLFNKVESSFLPYFLEVVIPDMNNRGIPIVCPVSLRYEDALHITIGEIKEMRIQLKLVWNCQEPEVITGLDDYVRDGDSIYSGPNPVQINEFFILYPIDQDGQSQVSGDGIPYFIEMLSGEWSRYISGNRELLLSTHIIRRDAQLILHGNTSVVNGVGKPIAIPMLSVNDSYISSSQISRQIRPGSRFVTSDLGWLPVSLLNRIGIGPMGRATNGSSLETPFQLTPAEIINRGSGRLEGPWNRFELTDIHWQNDDGDPIFQHLQFLSEWGINGGVKGGQSQWSKPLHMFLQNITKQYTSAHILIVGKMSQLESLKEVWGDSLDIFWLTSSAIFTKFTGQNPTCIAVTPSVLSKQDVLQKNKYDMLITLEPDTITKSTETQIYRILANLKTRLRLSLFSSEEHLKHVNVNWSHMNLLGLHDETLQRYAVLDPEQVIADLPVPYRMKIDNRLQNSQSIKFTDIDLEEETPGVSIPPKGYTVSSQGTTLSSHIQSRERSFVEEARQRVQERGPRVPFVPFISYWPTYQHMTDPQSRWYFYWRSEVRNDRYLSTDLSYIFVYIYELINGVGWTDPEQGYALLDKIRIAYGDHFSQLNPYLIDWISDFVLVHSIDIPLIDILTRSNGSLSGELVDMELLRLFEEQPSQISLDLLLTLSDYDMKRNKFYQVIGKLDLEFYTPRVIAVVDGYLFKTYGLKLIEMFMPGNVQVTERQLFRSAVYDDTIYGKTTTISAVPVRSHVPLREYLTQIYKFTENKLRDLRDFKGRLRGISLDQEMERLIDRYLEKEFSQKVAVQPIITIDTERLASLQHDTDYVRSMLTIEDPVDHPDDKLESNSEDYPLELILTEERQPEFEPVKDHAVKVKWDTSLLDEDWLQFASILGSCQLEALHALKSSSPETELVRVAEEYGTMPALIVDEINNAAMETIGDLVIDGERIVEEYLNYLDNLKG